MMRPDSWDELQLEWRALAVSIDRGQLRQRIERELRRARRARLGAGIFTLTAALGICLALLHTPTMGDLARAAAVVTLIALAWWIERAQRSAVSTDLRLATETYLEAARQRARVQLRALKLTWTIVVAALAFLLPWWIEGYQYHADDLFTPLTMLGGWLPTALVLAILIWTFRLRQQLRAELGQLERLARNQ